MSDQTNTSQTGSAATNAHVAMGQAVDRINQDFKEKEIEARAKELGFGYVDILHKPINPDVFELIDYKQAQEAKLVPFSQLGNTVYVAISDPNDPLTKKILSDLTKERYFDVRPYLASTEGIATALAQFAEMFKDHVAVAKPETPATSEDYMVEIAALEKIGAKLHQLGDSQEGLQELELGALSTHASDIHFQPEGNKAMVRFRIDGVLHPVTQLDASVYKFFATQIKHKAGMKINVTNVPQDGRYTLETADHKVDIRVSSLPTEFGDSIVLRFLDTKEQVFELEALGYREPTLSLLKNAQELSQGMIMVTGPTGSGKSTTLYTLLQAFNQPERKLITLENPVEYKLAGVVQSPINEEEGYTFANGLESILRQDPDVIMVGEIRDISTAETSAQAALTGHIVLCTLHTNNAIEAIPRFINMGVKPFIAAPALNIIVAQRLVRKLCVCKEQRTITEMERKFMMDIIARRETPIIAIPDMVFAPKGCQLCSHTGFKGRLVIAEGFKVNEEIEELILNQGSLQEIRNIVINKQQMRTMVEDGIGKVVEGITTVDEVKRVAMF